jgi:hypothetical protein
MPQLRPTLARSRLRKLRINRREAALPNTVNRFIILAVVAVEAVTRRLEEAGANPSQLRHQRSRSGPGAATGDWWFVRGGLGQDIGTVPRDLW